MPPLVKVTPEVDVVISLVAGPVSRPVIGGLGEGLAAFVTVSGAANVVYLNAYEGTQTLPGLQPPQFTHRGLLTGGQQGGAGGQGAGAGGQGG